MTGRPISDHAPDCRKRRGQTRQGDTVAQEPCSCGIDGGLDIWVVYDSPSDFPGRVVVRRQIALSDRRIAKDARAFLFPTLDDARRWLADLNLTCLPRFPDDDPVIVETWL